MSAYQKYNGLLKSHSAAEVAERIVKNFGPHGPPEAMFNKLAPDLKDCLLMLYVPSADGAPRTNNSLSKMIRRKEDQQRARIKNGIAAALADKLWWEVLACDRDPDRWTILPTDTAAGHIDAMEARVAAWWECRRSQNTSVERCLEEMFKHFRWPNKLPAAKTLTDMIAHPQALAIDPHIVHPVVRTWLAALKDQRRAAKMQQQQLSRERRAAREEAKRQALEQRMHEVEQLRVTGRVPDGDHRSWRRLSEVAELIGLSASTLLADMKKGHLIACDRVRANKMYGNYTTLHSRPDLKAYLQAHRPNIDASLMDCPTASEQGLRLQLQEADRWDELLARPYVGEGHKLTAPVNWPAGIALQIADNTTQARQRCLGAPTTPISALEQELQWLSDTWPRVLSDRIQASQWSPSLMAAVHQQLAQSSPSLSHQVVWPNGFLASLERKKLDKLLDGIVSSLAHRKSHLLSFPSGKNLHNPFTWYPRARAQKRSWVLHLGPTNSGKTHHAMTAMMASPTGVYLAPLRLMALEGFDRLIANNKCAQLITGEERQSSTPMGNDKKDPALLHADASLGLINDASQCTHVSATIEAGFDEERVFDVAVIDEAQMINDPDRGWAWAQALAGVRAQQLHVCASLDAKNILLALAKKLGENVKIVEHQRLTPLHEISTPIGLNNLTKGDALVTFSRRQLLGYRSWLRSKGQSVAVIYGDLGPEVRRAEAERFRSGAADILVSTDAIGMGLNLPIQRVIFADTCKFDGVARRPLASHEWKQIAGRAGRHGLYDKGYYGRLSNTPAFSKDQSSEMSWRFRPPVSLVRHLGHQMGWTSLRQVINFWSVEQPGVECSLWWSDPSWMEFLSQSSLSLEDQYRYVHAPINTKDQMTLKGWVNMHALGQAVPLPDGPIPQPASNRVQLESLEMFAAKIRLYRWCALTFPHIYQQDTTALHSALASCIADSLSSMALDNLCDSCGVRLPVGHAHANCDACFRRKRNDWY